MGYHRDLQRFAVREVYQIQETMYEATPWTYCGMPSSDDEHVLPRTYTSRFQDLPDVMPANLNIVPACRECNLLASKAVLDGIQDKRVHIHEKLRQCYKSVLEIPQWTEEQLAELSPELAQFVRHGLRLRGIILSRLRWKGNSGHVSNVGRFSRRGGPHKNFVKQRVVQPSIMRSSQDLCISVEIYQSVSGD